MFTPVVHHKAFMLWKYRKPNKGWCGLRSSSDDSGPNPKLLDMIENIPKLSSHGLTFIRCCMNGTKILVKESSPAAPLPLLKF